MKSPRRVPVRLLIILPLLALLVAPTLAGNGDKRVVLIKVDGLPPDLLAAVAFPENAEYLARLAYAKELEQQIRYYREQTGRKLILPNIRHYLFEEGVYVENMYSETLTLSAAAWAVVDTGHPSVIKGHATFSRDTSYLRSHLDGLRDTIDAMRHGESKTAALWNLDQIGNSLMLDAFNWDRTWSGPQIYRREANRELLLETGIRWLNNDQQGIGNIVESHLSRLVTGLDYTEFAQEMSGRLTAKKILETDLEGHEQFDYLSPLFTLMDHQQHVDPHPENLIHWLVKLDILVGEIFFAVESSQRRNETLVALVSDHGSEIDPGKVAYSFPITQVFRTPEFGGHNVKTLLVESAWNALSVPIPGIDFPRVYESSSSPYGKAGGQHGEDGFVTCYIDPFGNARAAVNLRNDDLNQLHLLLLQIKRDGPGGSRLPRLRELFQKTLERTKIWLEPDYRLMVDYRDGAQDLAENLSKKSDVFSLDVAWRLREELKRDRPLLEALARLLSLRFDSSGEGLLFEDAFGGGNFKIDDFIPKQYLGLANNIHQLSHYTLGLDQDLNWVHTGVNPQGKPVTMDYFQRMDDFRAPNPPAPGLENPFDLIVTRIPQEQIQRTLEQRKLVSPGTPLKNVMWLKSTQDGDKGRGEEALVIQRSDLQVKYIPIRNLKQDSDLEIRFELESTLDPLGLLQSPRFRGEQARLPWLARFQIRDNLEAAIFETEYGIAMLSLLDIINDPVPEFVDNSEFREFQVSFSSDQIKKRYLRGLKRKYASLQPDFTVWANSLWNFNSKARTSGGSHSGLKPIVSRTAFMVWGGDNTDVARGKVISKVATTLDIVPTLFRGLDMLDDQNRVIRRPGSVPERPFLRYPGRVLDIWRSPPASEAPPR